MLSMRNILMAATATAIVLLDQLTKAWALEALEGVTISVIDGLLAFRLGFNYGLAFGILGDVPAAWRSAVALLPLAALLILVRIMRKELPRGWPGTVSVSLVLGGAIGNLIDRVRVGAVVDFIDFYWRGIHWPAFNVADSAISIGVALLAVSLTRAGNGKSKNSSFAKPSSA